MIEKDRLLALTDGIIAIAATIMVLELDIPSEINWNTLSAQLPTLFAYIISFMQVFLAWHEHHDACADAKFFNHRLMFVNAMWLFFITLLPFGTGMVGANPHNRMANIIYIAILFAINIVIKIECSMIEKLNKIKMRDHNYIIRLQNLSFTGLLLASVACYFEPFASLVIIICVNIASVVGICTYDVAATERNLLKLGIVKKGDWEEKSCSEK